MTPSVLCGIHYSGQTPTLAALGAQLAEHLDLRLVLAHAVAPTVPAVTPGWPARAPYDSSELHEAAREAGEQLLGEVAEEAGVAGATFRVEGGAAADSLLRLAEDEGARLIVVGTHGGNPAQVMAMGSVSLDVARQAPCPVLVVPPAVERASLIAPEVDTVVCGLAGPDDSEPLRVAIQLARALRLSVLPAHVVPPQEEDLSAERIVRIQSVLSDRLREAGLGRARVAEAIGADGISRLERDGLVLAAGDPADELAQLAADARAALVVVGTRGRGPIRSAVLGSVSRSLARHAGCPVVICPRPE
jgi:nucleotide-binding universal stress UspA family protein